MEEGREIKPKRKHAALRAVIFSFLGLWAFVIIALQVLLNSKVITRVVDKVASEYVDGSIEFSKITASMFRSFPYFNVTIDSCSITYPHDKFAAFDDSLGVDDFMMRQGRGAETDTLVHFDRFSAAIDYVSLIFGKYRIRHVELSRPKIFAHQYDSLNANWNIFRLASKEDSDTSSHPLPPITISHVRLSERPLIIYTNPSDTVFGTIVLKNLNLDGRLTNEKGRKNDLSFSLDSLFFSGRLPADTVAFALDQMRIKNHRDHSDVEMHSKALLALHSAGRMEIPIDFDGHVRLNLSGKEIDVPKLALSIAGIDIKGNLLLRMSGENPYLKTDLSVNKEKISDIASTFKDNFPILGKISTDATLSLNAHCDGEFADGSLPEISAHVQIPRSSFAYEGLDSKGLIDLDATVRSKGGRLTAEIPDICLKVRGLDLNLSGNADDLAGGDPLLTVDSDLSADLDSLSALIPDSLGIVLHGQFDGNISGTTNLSQLDPFNFSTCGLKGSLNSTGVEISVPKDTLYAFLGRSSINVGPDDDVDANSVTALSLNVDSLYAKYSQMFIHGTTVKLLAHNSADTVKSNPGKYPIHGHLEIGSLAMFGADSVFLGIENSENIFKYSPNIVSGKSEPNLQLSSTQGEVTVRSGVDRYSLSGLRLNVSANPSADADLSRSRKLDSLQKLYPTIPRDSLFRHAMRLRMAGRPIPDYLSEADFRKKDIDIHLSGAMANLIKNWDMAGTIKVDSGLVITPYYPLDNRLAGLSGRFTNDEIDLDKATALSGSSDMSVAGTLKGLKRALSGRGRSRLNLNLSVTSNFINLDEILLAINSGKKFKPVVSDEALEGIDDKSYLEKVQNASSKDTVIERSTFILPSNLIAKMSLQTDRLKFSELETSWLSSDFELKQRCLQVTNTMVMSNMGEMYLEGFYSTKTKKDLKAGFDLMLSNITAEKVIRLFPAVDSIVPMLKAFNGLLDCEMAATATIDDKMNILLPTLNGIIKIDGKNLLLEGGKEIDKLRKTLRFKDRDTSIIADMSIRGIIKDNQLEIFPFMLNVDRYSVALSGLQKFDQTFKYHFSALKSPIPFRFGVNLKGSFAKWGWKLGKAKYKSKNLPSFDDQVEDLRLNLVNSIHNIYESGVDQAMIRTEKSQEAIEQKKTQLDYISDPQTDSLSTTEKGIMKTLEKIASGETD